MVLPGGHKRERNNQHRAEDCLPPTAYCLPPTAYRLPPTAYRLLRKRFRRLLEYLPFPQQPEERKNRMNNGPKRILLADDNANDLELTLSALAEHNLAQSVAVARDGAEVLDYLYRDGVFESREEGNPDVVLLDLKMPKVDGLEVLKRVKSDPKLKTIPIVVLTSSPEERDIVESYSLGVNAYVVKPVDYGEFVRAVKEVGLFWGVINAAPSDKSY